MALQASLGDRIRIIRKTNQLNQNEFSNLIGISQATQKYFVSEGINRVCDPTRCRGCGMPDVHGCDGYHERRTYRRCKNRWCRLLSC